MWRDKGNEQDGGNELESREGGNARTGKVTALVVMCFIFINLT